MANRNIMTSLLTVGAAGAAIYGISKGIQNGTFQRLPQKVSNMFGNPTIQQATQQAQNFIGNQSGQNNNSYSQSSQEQMGNDNSQL